ncbi:MAG: polyamine aminopropyltransferase [Neisseria sp.]|nr:polyamine aminopropyltransferase [Neisseria sp.]
MKHHPYQRHKRRHFPEVSISESGNIRSLHLGTDTVQSAMNLDNPSELVLSYSRAMMAWLLFTDEAQHLTHIGLGGGSMVRWLDAHFPDLHQLAIEINPKIVAVAKSMFELPHEDENFEIVVADGAEFIRVLYGSTDVILTDGFDGEQIIDDLVSEAFFADCYHALTKNGIFATNLWSGDARYAVFVQRLAAVFSGKILEIPAATHGNVAVLAFRNLPRGISNHQLKQRAAQLTTATGTDFQDLFFAARAANEQRKLW